MNTTPQTQALALRLAGRPEKEILKVVWQHARKLESQRDELLASLKDMVHYDDLSPEAQEPALERAHAAIAKVLGARL